METIVSIKPLLAVLVSTVGAFFIIATRKNPNFREAWSIFAGVLKLVIVLSMIPAVVYDKTIITYSLFTILPGIEIGFRVILPVLQYRFPLQSVLHSQRTCLPCFFSMKF